MRRIIVGLVLLAALGGSVIPASAQVASNADVVAEGSDLEAVLPGPPPVDDVGPTVTIVRPRQGAVYRQGQVVTASYSCDDGGGSGVAVCSGPVASGGRLATGSVGVRSFSVTAQDVAGNPTVVTHNYRVVRYRGDMLIRRGNQPSFVGDGVYNLTGGRQTVEASVEARGSFTGFVRVQNDGTYRDRLVLRGTGSGQNFEVQYFRGSANVTGAVRRGTYRTPILGPSGTHTLRVVVTARASAGPGTRITIDVLGRSVGDSTKRDLVSATVRRPLPPPPPPPSRPPGNCNPNYTPCVPNASDVDCAGGQGDGPVYVQGPVRVIGTDVYGLDRDNNGIGCD